MGNLNKPKLKYYNLYLDNDGEIIKSSNPEMQTFLKGKYGKTFMRCNSGFLRELFDEIKNNPECSYVTYLNDFIKENYDGKTLPIKSVSVLVKDVPYGKETGGYMEEVVSRLGNVFGVAVPFNKYVKGEDGDYILSVDFIGKNERFDNLNKYFTDYDLIERYNISDSDDSLYQNSVGNNFSLEEEWYKNFMGYPRNLATKEPLSDKQKEKLFIDFIPRYLFRKWVVSDYDLYSRNEGVLYNNQTGEFKTLSYDFEYAFSYMYDVFQLAHDIVFLMKKYPNELDKFVENYSNNAEKLDGIFENIDDILICRAVRNYITKNLLFLFHFYNKAKDIVSSDDFDGDYSHLYDKLIEFHKSFDQLNKQM